MREEGLAAAHGLRGGHEGAEHFLNAGQEGDEGRQKKIGPGCPVAVTYILQPNPSS